MNTKIITLLSLVLPLGLAACGDKDDDTGHVHEADADTDSDTDADYEFATDDPGDYTRVDRAGMPAINTAVVTSKDDYNAANPSDDASLTFGAEILSNLAALHTALDPALESAGLTPCTVVGDLSGTCVAVAAPLVIPDTLKMDVTSSAGFPNGRLLSDPVMDVTLAVVLLELSDGTHTAVDLVGLNPTANDVDFEADFPWVAPAH